MQHTLCLPSILFSSSWEYKFFSAIALHLSAFRWQLITLVKLQLHVAQREGSHDEVIIALVHYNGNQ